MYQPDIVTYAPVEEPAGPELQYQMTGAEQTKEGRLVPWSWDDVVYQYQR
jgi:hypothetical protein